MNIVSPGPLSSTAAMAIGGDGEFIENANAQSANASEKNVGSLAGFNNLSNSIIGSTLVYDSGMNIM